MDSLDAKLRALVDQHEAIQAYTASTRAMMITQVIAEKRRLVLRTFDQRLDVHVIEEKRNIPLVKTVQGFIGISWLEQVRSCREASGGKDRQQKSE